LHQWNKAQALYRQVIALDADNGAAHLGLSRVALERKQFQIAVDAALCAVQRRYQDPQAHYALGIALAGLGDFHRAAEALRAAISLNPNYPEAHLRLASILDRRLKQPGAAREHRRLVRRMQSHAAVPEVNHAPEPARFDPVSGAADGGMPMLEESLIVVTGIPRSGTSMLMQMLEAGGTPVLTDRLRAADEDNPRGYFEFEPVKDLFRDSNWLASHKGKAVKIVAPLVAALPPGLPCRVILCERDLDEVLDSQERMLSHHSPPQGRRATLKSEYARLLAGVKATLANRPCTRVLALSHGEVTANPGAAAHQLNQFLGGVLDEVRAAQAIDASLHRNRSLSINYRRSDSQPLSEVHSPPRP